MKWDVYGEARDRKTGEAFATWRVTVDAMDRDDAKTDALCLMDTTCATHHVIEIDGDPTPWCSGCGAMTKAQCKCGEIARAE